MKYGLKQICYTIKCMQYDMKQFCIASYCTPYDIKQSCIPSYFMPYDRIHDLLRLRNRIRELKTGGNNTNTG